MDPLDKITTHSVELATFARNAYQSGYPDSSYRYLGELYDFLDDEVGSGARDKRESTESSNGS